VLSDVNAGTGPIDTLRPGCHFALSKGIINLIYIPLVEEPQLGRRFGDSYREYVVMSDDLFRAFDR
jgi:hypothetical protein